jgi:MFS superfamily sulfate permease-like transporter
MDWKWVSIAFFLLGFALLPVWPYTANWRAYPSVFCFFVAVLTLLVSLFAKRGSSVWKHKGQG